MQQVSRNHLPRRVTRIPHATRWACLAVFCSLAMVVSGESLFAAARQSELTTAAGPHRGRVLCRNDTTCWLLDQDGSLSDVRLSQVTSFRTLKNRPAAMTHAQLRDELAREFDRTLVIAASEHYLVCAPTREAARLYADTFEELYRTFRGYFSIRNIPVAEPEFALVAVVWPDARTFSEYCLRDDIRAMPGLAGYYSPQTNRVALYETDWENLRNTIIHEGTHQVAFNTGVHSRVGETPKWLVEGLATTFEVDGVRHGQLREPVLSRVNRDRLSYFAHSRDNRGTTGRIEEVITSDNRFRTDTLQAYADAWAVTFFLLETRPTQYANYLAAISKRDPLRSYTAEQRLEDFRKAFGADLPWLDVEFQRFMERLQ